MKINNTLSNSSATSLLVAHQRVPIFLGLFLIGFPQLVWLEDYSSMVAGAFEVTSFWGMTWVAFICVLSAWTGRTICFAIKAGVEERFRFAPVDEPSLWIQRLVNGFWLTAAGMIPLVCLIKSLIYNDTLDPYLLYGAGVGIPLALIVMATLVIFFKRMYPESESLKRVLVIPFFRDPSADREDLLFKMIDFVAKSAEVLISQIYVKVDWVVNKIPRCVELSGLVKEEGSRLELVKVHRFLLLYSVLIFMIAITLSLLPWQGSGWILVSVVLFVNFVVQIVSFITFFFDRWSIPTVIPTSAVLGLFLVFSNPTVDQLNQGKTFSQIPPDEIVSIMLESKITKVNPNPPKVVFVISAEGGGIHSGAWACHILATLQQKLSEADYPFANSIICCSGVSGGSYGLMYWLDCYQDKTTFNDIDLLFEKTRESAMTTSLGGATGGLLYGDLMKLPWVKGRGGMLEREWSRSLTGRPTISSWSAMVKENRMPAFLINSTVVESGAQVTFATCKLPQKGLTGKFGHYENIFGRIDMPISSAVRCSATFPYVTPTVSIEGSNGLHLADGGYFDNTGIYSAIRFIESIKKDDVSVIFINILEQEMGNIETVFSGSKPLGSVANEVAGPLSAVLKVRSNGHRAFVLSELTKLKQGCGNISSVTTIEFVYPYKDQALSWHLTRQQKDLIRGIKLDQIFEIPEVFSKDASPLELSILKQKINNLNINYKELITKLEDLNER